MGQLLREHARREEIVIATKVQGPMGKGPNMSGLSRKAIMQEVDASLRRLGTDYIDLYQIHRLDRRVPMGEILEAMHDVVKAGKARYIGASSMFAWEFATTLQLQKANGWTRFVSMQNYLNLLYREEEREMLPLCAAEGVGVIPWSPLARGKLTGDWDTKTARAEDDWFADFLYTATAEADRTVVERVAQLAESRGVPRAQVALSWVAGKAEVTAPIIGATKLSHIYDAVARPVGRGAEASGRALYSARRDGASVIANGGQRPHNFRCACRSAREISPQAALLPEIAIGDEDDLAADASAFDHGMGFGGL